MVEDENTKNPSGLSEFFNALSKEKAEARQKIKEKIDDPESGLSSLFHQLEEALQETKNVSVEEDFDNTKLSDDDQNKLEVFSNLLNELGSDKETPNEVEPTDFVEEVEPEEIIPEELVVESEEPHEITEPQNDIITSVIRNLEDMSRKTQVKEEIEQISSIRKEFDNFRSFIGQQIASLQMSGAGSGEVRLEFLDDVDRDTAKVNNKYLKYNSTTGKWAGADASGSGSSDEEIQDVVGAMFSSNTETGVTATYQDGDGTIDLVVGTLNQDTTGTAATVTTAAQPNITSLGTLTTLTVDNIIINDANIGHTSDTDSIAIASDGVVTFSQVPVFPNDTVETADIQDNAVTLAKMAGLARGKIIYGDSSGDPAALAVGTNGYVLTSDGTDISWTEVSASSLAADNLSAGDAAVTLTTSSGNITIDAAANNTNIIFKGTDGGSDITMLTLDGSAAGAATFNDKIVATELDISGDVDVDGTLEADAYTVDGTTLAEYIADTAGAMVSSNTETGIAVTYQDGDNTIDFAVDAAQTTITSIYNSSLAIGYGSSHANINFGTDNQITLDIDGTGQIVLKDGLLHPVTDSDVDLGKSDKYWKDAYIDTITTTGTITSSSQISADSFNLPITLNGTDGSSTDAGDNIVQNTAANENDRIVYEDATPTHSERPITWDRTT